MTKTYGLAADLHFHQWSAFAGTTADGQNTRLVGLLSELDRLCKTTKDTGGEFVILAGDIFHVRGSVAPSVLNAVMDKIRFCSSDEGYGTRFVILAGNHDLEGKDSSRLGSAITALEGTRVQVVNEPTYHKETRTVLVPWYESVEQLKAVIEKLGTGGMDKFFRENTDLILHAPIDGVIEGLPPHGLTPDYLSKLGYKRVFAGHYHNHRVFPGNVHSIGALAHHTWSDIQTKAGFVIVHPDEIYWMKSHLPEFIDVDTLVDVEEGDLEFLIAGHFVRVKLESSSAKKVAELREELTSMGAAGVLIQATPTPPKREDGVAVTVAAGASLEASIGEFTKQFGERQAAVLTAAMSILSAASAVEV